MKFPRPLVLLALIGLVSALQLLGQSQQDATPSPTFEVAAIKPDRSGDFRFSVGFQAGRFTASGMTAKALIEYAYELKDDQISGGPSWIDSERFDIDAKMEDSRIEALRKLSQEEQRKQNRQALRSLLADRFHLRVSHQTKEMPVYALEVAKGGPKLSPTSVKLPDPGGTNSPGPPKGALMRMGPGELVVTAAHTWDLAEGLSRLPEIGGRVILDKTGLTGSYDFTLKWTPSQQMFAPGAVGPEAPPPPDPSAPSIFTAVQEQLGLKLESQKGPVDVLVIDHIEQPSSN